MLWASIIKTYIGGKNTMKETITNCNLYDIINHFLHVMMRKIRFTWRFSLVTSLYNAVFIWKPCKWDDPNYNLQFSDQYLYSKCLAFCMATCHFSDDELGTDSSLNSGEYSIYRTGAPPYEVSSEPPKHDAKCGFFFR